MNYKNILFLVVSLFFVLSANSQTFKPKFPGGADALEQYMHENLKMPENGNYIGGEEGFVVKVKFLVSKTGKLSNIKALISDDGYTADTVYVNEAERFVRSMPDWIPGKKNGVKQAMSYTLTVNFEKSSGFGESALVEMAPAWGIGAMSDNDIVDNVPDMPQFPGGESEMFRFLSTNLKYPEEAAEQGIQGKVIVNFVVEKDGSLSNIEVKRGIDPLCDKEAVRVVKAMPKWSPGKLNDKPVRVNFTLPFIFKLSQ